MEQPYSPTSFGPPPGGSPRPKNWLVESILVTLFCCLPFGIVGIINASSVNTKYDAGDYAGAQQASEQAGKWTKIGFFVGLASVAVWFVLSMLGVGAGLLGGMSN